MSHDDQNSRVGLSGKKVFDPIGHSGSTDFTPNPALLSEATQNAGSEMAASPSNDRVVGEPPQSVVEYQQPEVVKKSIHQMQDDLLVRSWLSGKSPHTKRAYMRLSDEFFAWIHPRTLKEASIHDLQSFVDARVGQKKNTIAQKTAAVKSLFTFAYKTGYSPANLGVFVRGVKGVKRLTERYLSVDEVRSMLSKTTDPRDLAVLRLLYVSGVRVSELVALNWKDVQERSEGEAQIKILGKGEKERVIRISKNAYDALKAIRPEDFKPHLPLFPSQYGTKSRLSDRTVREIVFKAAMRAGISKRASPHWLRHSHASHALDHGAPLSLIKDTFGHASIATTSEYVHARPDESSGRYLPESE